MFRALSTLTLLLLACGFMLRRRRELHVWLMSTAFGLDLSALAMIEATRGAIHKTMTCPSLSLFVHVAASVLVLATYVAMAPLGIYIRRGNERYRPWHRRVAWVFGAARVTNYVTSWML
ncbi:MAG: hypothetical protein HY233_10480 [Acidobacteriales bacterium]|nr:hypothetical protein [Terriglobales bacterium]